MPQSGLPQSPTNCHCEYLQIAWALFNMKETVIARRSLPKQSRLPQSTTNCHCEAFFAEAISLLNPCNPCNPCTNDTFLAVSPQHVALFSLEETVIAKEPFVFSG
jgi:hypothetical protein